jgi:CheY-like chemotaxis protein
VPPAARGPILILDDDVDVLRMLESVIRRDGRDVVTTPDPREALTLCREREPAVVFVDLMLPHMDGEQFIAELRRDTTVTQPKIVIISASAIREDIAGRLDVEATLPKPFDLDDVLELLERLDPR